MRASGRWVLGEGEGEGSPGKLFFQKIHVHRDRRVCQCIADMPCRSVPGAMNGEDEKGTGRRYFCYDSCMSTADFAYLSSCPWGRAGGSL
jgi:hypothetical protein